MLSPLTVAQEHYHVVQRYQLLVPFTMPMLPFWSRQRLSVVLVALLSWLAGAAPTELSAVPNSSTNMTLPAASAMAAQSSKTFVPHVLNAKATFRYVFPVRATSIQYGPDHHDYPATDIFCPVGSEFAAPTDGIVDFVRREDLWDPQTDVPADRGGLAVAIIGDDGVRYYGSHLSAVANGIEPGERVVGGQVLGLTGKSGDARSTPAHLHFGISRPTTPDDWQVRRGQISPYPYLQAWARGEMLSPVPEFQP